MLSVDKALVGNRPAGQTPANSPIVQAAVSVTRALGFPVTLDEGSTDSNIAMNLGIPAITIDGGGRGRGSHALDESFDQTNSWQGSQRALLLCIALAQQQQGSEVPQVPGFQRFRSDGYQVLEPSERCLGTLEPWNLGTFDLLLRSAVSGSTREARHAGR